MISNKKNIQEPESRIWPIAGTKSDAISLSAMRAAHISSRLQETLCAEPEMEAEAKNTSAELEWLNLTATPFVAGGAINERELLFHTKNLLNRLKEGSCDNHAISQGWKELLNEMEIQQRTSFTGWNEKQRAELFKILTDLRRFGCRVTIPGELRARPADPAAAKLWREAQRNLGIQLST